MILSTLKFLFICVEVILIFNLMILVHEWGHYLAARWRGLVVEKFAIWFGKPIWKKTINGVEYRLGSIPAGGYVAIPQLAPMELLEGEVENDRSKYPPIRPIDKIIVAAAGPLFSILLAFFFAVLVWGLGRPVGEMETSTVVGYAVEDGPAAQAGILPGDKIVSIDGKEVTQFGPAGNARQSIVWNVASSEDPTIAVEVERDGALQTFDITPATPPRNGWGRANLRQIGILPAVTPKIASVSAGTPEEAAGFKSGDIILDANGQPVRSFLQLSTLLDEANGQPLPVTVQRGDQTLELPMPTIAPGVDSVVPDGPAARAGVQAGDVITAVDGEPLRSRKSLSDLLTAGGGAPVVLTVQRGEQTTDLTVTPEIPKDGKNPKVGIAWISGGIAWDLEGQLTRIHPNPFQQIQSSMTMMADTLGAVISTKSEIGLQHLSGPVGIMNVYYRLFERQDGWLLAIWFSVVLNVNLALLNLLPIPVLDGGHITLAIIEKIMKRPVNVRVLEFLQNGFALALIGFMLYVTFYDVIDLHLFGGGESAPAMEFKK